MHWTLTDENAHLAYNLLAATVSPRPIAWVVTRGTLGLNAAPYSFFNVMGHAPPTVALGLTASGAGGFKDTARNILENGEFVVNLVSEPLADAMNLTAINAPPTVNELELAGLATTPSQFIAPPRITASPVAFECRAISSVVTGPHQTVVIGRVLAVYVQDAFVLNPERGHIDTPAMNLIGRSGGLSYVRGHDHFELERPKWQGGAG